MPPPARPLIPLPAQVEVLMNNKVTQKAEIVPAKPYYGVTHR